MGEDAKREVSPTRFAGWLWLSAAGLAGAQTPAPAPECSACSFLWEGEGGGKPWEAARGGFTFEHYFGNEGHTIEYAAEDLEPGRAVRLTMRRTAENQVAVPFEIAPPGKPEAFSPYVEGRAKRKPR